MPEVDNAIPDIEHDDPNHVCAACDFEAWAGESLVAAHHALIDALEVEGALRVRAIVHAMEHLEDELDGLYGAGD